MIKAKEYIRSGWRANRKCCKETMDCYGSVRTKVGTANIPNGKEYQKKNIGEYDLEENQRNVYTEESGSKEIRDTTLEEEIQTRRK